MLTKLRAFLADLYHREPAMITAVLTSAVTAIIGWVVASGWLDLTADQTGQAVVWIVGFVVAIITGGVITRQSVYSPATVDRITYAPRHAGPTSNHYELDPVTGTYLANPVPDAAWHPISAAEGEARVQAAFPEDHYTTGGDE